MKKTLTKIIGAGALTLALIGCGQPEYRYDGQIEFVSGGAIEEEKVKYYDTDFLNSQHVLQVVQSDGTLLVYRCMGLSGSNKVNSIMIAKQGAIGIYGRDKYGDEVLKKGQKQYDWYLAKILETKSKKRLEDINN